MAKLDTYGSSPNCSLFNDWNLTSEPFSNSDFGIVDPDPIELFEDLNDWPPSIFSDIKKIQSDTSAASSGSMSSGDGVHYIDFFEPEMKPEIRNIDCMWSAQPSSTGVGGGSVIQQDALAASSTVVAGVTTAVPLADVIENAQNISNNKQQLQPPAMYQRLGGNNKATSQHVASSDVQMKAGAVATDVSIKVEPIDDDYEKQLQQHSIPNSRTALLQQQQSLQHIKPGMSLLRKSNVQQQQKKQPQQQTSKFNGSIKIPAKTTAEFLRERDQSSAATAKNVAGFGAATPSAAFGRPDTPLSLDDDPVPNEFKHSVDLRACVMGSNNISLVANDPTNIINHLSEQLQDTTKNRIDLRNLMPDTACDFADVLDLIVKDDRSLASTALNTSISSCSDNQGHNRSNVHYLNKRSFESDDEEDVDDDDENDDDEYEDEMGSSCRSAASSTSSSSLHNRSLSSSVAGLNSSTSAYVSATSPLSSNGSSIAGVSGGVGGITTSSGNSSSSQQQQTYPIMLHSDHSYTRCNEDLGTNLETPSDSDEEIDVVSIGDKKLPTNPSAKDRRALQNKVAHKFSNARIVKTANGVRTIPPRRRITVELPYTPASSSPVKSVANSRYPSPSTTPYQNQYTSKYVQQQTQHMMSVMSGGGGEKHRKRMAAAATLAAPQSSAVGGLIRGGGVCVGSSSAGLILDYLPPSKKHRNGKKQKQQQQQQQQQLLQHQQQQYGGHESTSSSPSSSSSSAVASAGDIVNQRHYSLDETADTMEKRNLHNDMERQRRIGLKNLFEALKKQIPSIREKERAPKVNILREAAKLCEALTREDQLLSEQKMMLKEQLRKRQELLARLRSGGGIGTIVGGGSNAMQRD